MPVKFYKMDGQSGVDYYQKIIMLVVVYFEQKI